MLQDAVDRVRRAGYAVGNVDSNVLAERPRLTPYFLAMKRVIAEVMGVGEGDIHVKAKTMEKLDAVGAESAIAAEAIALVYEG
jgi:2-C-methyl-D-erythritol 2,4-cyclodiphosphate synthase